MSEENKTKKGIELTAKTFMDKCKVVNIEERVESQKINSVLIEAEIEKIKTKNL